jgi:hypothetical protein
MQRQKQLVSSSIVNVDMEGGASAEKTHGFIVNGALDGGPSLPHNYFAKECD